MSVTSSESFAIDRNLTPDISDIAIEDDTPVDNFFSAKLQRLLVEVLYTSRSIFSADRSFLADANVGIFYGLRQPPIVPDMFLSMDVEVPQDFRQKRNRTYFVWEFGKPPDVAIEIVSNQEGNELGSKLTIYARIGVTYYAIFDPLEQLGEVALRVYVLREGCYEPLPKIVVSEHSLFPLERIGLGLTLWQGEFEDKQDTWLRWCNLDGDILPTGAERAEAERQRAEAERQRAEVERQRADDAEAKAERLAERLRQMGIDPQDL
jgi:Uma2 family endonuclease